VIAQIWLALFPESLQSQLRFLLLQCRPLPSWGECIYSCLGRCFLSVLIAVFLRPCSSHGCHGAIFDKVACLATTKACPSSSSTLSNVWPLALKTCVPLFSLERGKVSLTFTSSHCPLWASYWKGCMRHQSLFLLKSSNRHHTDEY
jgi:hypothetical protein